MSDMYGMKEKVFDIQRFSVDDGPGIRTVIFLCGCPLSCIWCHNPEGMRAACRLLCNADRCVACEACGNVCPQGAHSFRAADTKGDIMLEHIIDRDICVACGECTRVCPEDALRLSCSELGVDDAFRELVSDLPFYKNSGGGVTFSGGEAMLQAESLAHLAQLLRDRGISVLIDTAGCVPYSLFEALRGKTDGYLFDFKTADAEKYKEIGGDLALVTENIRRLLADGERVEIRIPLIPRFNTDDQSVSGICAALTDLGIKSVTLLPFHRLGSAKYEAMGLKYAYETQAPLSRDDIHAVKSEFEKHFTVTVEG